MSTPASAHKPASPQILRDCAPCILVAAYLWERLACGIPPVLLSCESSGEAQDRVPPALRLQSTVACSIIRRTHRSGLPWPRGRRETLPRHRRGTGAPCPALPLPPAGG